MTIHLWPGVVQEGIFDSVRRADHDVLPGLAVRRVHAQARQEPAVRLAELDKSVRDIASALPSATVDEHVRLRGSGASRGVRLQPRDEVGRHGFGDVLEGEARGAWCLASMEAPVVS